MRFQIHEIEEVDSDISMHDLMQHIGEYEYNDIK